MWASLAVSVAAISVLTWWARRTTVRVIGSNGGSYFIPPLGLEWLELAVLHLVAVGGIFAILVVLDRGDVTSEWSVRRTAKAVALTVSVLVVVEIVFAIPNGSVEFLV